MYVSVTQLLQQWLIHPISVEKQIIKSPEDCGADSKRAE
jgi:hypothetical protein